MTNAEKFKCVFGLYATELWAMDENDMLKWLNADCKEPDRKTGRWMLDRDGWLVFCSECGCHPWFGVIPTVAVATEKLPHCPVCLADMTEEEQDG